MPHKNQRITYWLMPSEESRKPLQQLIDKFAKRYGSPSFLPHLTLFVTEVNPKKSPKKVLGQIKKESLSLSLTIEGIESGQTLTKTLFLTFKLTSALEELNKQIRLYSSSNSDYQLIPHMSLLYHENLNIEEKNKLIEQIAIEEKVINFDAIKAVAISKETKSIEDIYSWKEVAYLERIDS